MSRTCVLRRSARSPSGAPGELHFEVHELDGHSNVTRPTPSRALRHLSELIDPADLAAGSQTQLATIGEAGAGEGQAGNATGTTTTVTTPKKGKTSTLRR